jgi:RNA-directed DNA polymerase
MMNEHRKSDRPVVPAKLPNNVMPKSGVMAEAVEGRGLTEGNLGQQNTERTPSREGNVPSALERIRQKATEDKRIRFTSLLHHIYDEERLNQAYEALEHRAAPGMDGQTWPEYGKDLEDHLKDLSGRLARGAYRAKPARRTYIPKADGKQRPLGIPVLEDKIVQRATVEVLNAIYEADFLGFSYGFRPGRGQHNALDALYSGLVTRKVNWVLDADITRFFDKIDHGWMVKFLEHRIGDRRVVRLFQKWMKAGVLEDGQWKECEEGTPQGGSASPLMANVYLHYVFDLWAQQWRDKQAQGDRILVRYADDVVVGFEHRADAERFQAELKERLLRFWLELHPEKTRLLEFGAQATYDRKTSGRGSPETFNFLGFTHCCGTTRGGRFTVVRRTIKKRLQGKLQAIRQELKRRRHEPVPDVGHWLKAVVRGHFNYYGVPTNLRALDAFRVEVGRAWHWALRRRSEKHRMSKARMARLIERWIPPAEICHPYPLRRMYGMT